MRCSWAVLTWTVPNSRELVGRLVMPSGLCRSFGSNRDLDSRWERIDLHMKPVSIGTIIWEMKLCIVYMNATKFTKVGARFLDPYTSRLTICKIEHPNLKLQLIDMTIFELIVNDFRFLAMTLKRKADDAVSEHCVLKKRRRNLPVYPIPRHDRSPENGRHHERGAPDKVAAEASLQLEEVPLGSLRSIDQEPLASGCRIGEPHHDKDFQE